MIYQEEVLREAVALRNAHATVQDASRASGIPRQTLGDRLKRAAELGFTSSSPVMPGFAIKQVSGLDPEGNWVKQVRDHGEQFQIPKGHIVKGESALVDEDGRVVQKWIKTREGVDPLSFVEEIKKAFEGYEGRAYLTPAPVVTNSDLMSVYILADVHHGMLSWGKETGSDYDINIGSKRLRSCMTDLISQAPPSGEGLILNLGDFFHSNDQSNATPASKHQLDLDSRFYKVVTTGIRLFMDCIDLALQRHATVRVRCLPGNHDPESSLALTVALSAFYHNDPRVIVEEDPSDFFFKRFGATLIGACHGHRLKPERMAMTMAEMRKEDWGASKFRWFLFGHIHHDTVKEIGSVRCESFQTLASKDAYASSHGYHSGQSLTSVTLHKERGEIGRHKVNVI